MAFFGGDGLQRQLDQLKKQLYSKDSELTSIRNEHQKTQAELVDAKRGRSELVYKLEAEASQAHQAESSLAAKTTELSNIRLQYENLQSSLRTSNEKLKSSEKDNERLQYQLDIASHGARGREDELSEVKGLKKTLKAKEEEIAQLKARTIPPKSPGGPLKKSSTAYFPPSFTPAKTKSRRRSASSSADPRLGSLEAELDSLRSAQELEIAKVRAQLDSARKELDKVTNAKLALEKTTQKEVERMQSDLDDANYELEGWRRECQGSSGPEVSSITTKLKTAQAESVELQNKLDLAQAEVDRLTTTVAELQSRFEAPSSPGLSVRQYQREIKSLNSRIQTLEDELQVQDEEILKLKSAVPLPDSPGRIQQLEGDLDEQRKLVVSKIGELETLQKESELVAFGLQQERDVAKEDAKRLEGEVDSLETRAANAEFKVEELQQGRAAATSEHESYVTDLRGQTEALRTELAELKDRLQSASEHAETMQEKYEECARQKLGIENNLAELQASIANRSTESEAQDRMVEVFDLKEQVQQASVKLLSSENSLNLARLRITELESSVAMLTPLPSTSGRREVMLLEDKIARLRTERDELRLNLSYVQHEHRFARDAAEADRQSAVEDLQRTRTELEAKLDAISTLQTEHAAAKAELDTMTSRLEGVNGSYASASAEKNDLADKVTNLEVDLQDATSSRDQLLARVEELDKRLSERLEDSQVQHLISEVAMAQHKASKAEREMYSLLKANKDYEARVDKLQEQLEATMEVREMPERPASRIDRPPSRAERPPSRSDRPSSRGSTVGGGHIRRISQVYTGDSVDSLRVEKVDLLSRVQNRENRIEAMRIEMRQLKANLQLAEEAAEEVGQEKLEVERELEDLVAATALTEEEAQSTIRELVLALATHRQFVAATQRDWEMQRASLKDGNDTLARISSDASAALISATSEIASLSARLDESKIEIDTLKELVESGTASLEEAVAARDRAETLTAERQAIIEDGVVDRLALEERIRDLSVTLERDSAAHAAEMDGLRLEITHHEDLVDERTRELDSMRDQLATVTLDLARAEQRAASSATRVHDQDVEMDRLRSNITNQQQEISRLSAHVSDLERQLEASTEEIQKARLALELAVVEHERVSGAQETEIQGLRAQLEEAAVVDPNAASDLLERIAELEASLMLKLQEVDEADDRVREAFKAKTKLEKKVSKLQRALAAATTDHETAANTAANKIITVPTTTPRSKSMSTIPTERTPLRSVNIFDTSQIQVSSTSPGQGIKRPREGDEGEKKMPADCIVLQSTPGKGAVKRERAKSFGQRARSVRSPVH